MVRVAICSVGTELVSGEVADTNAAWLARQVREAGCDPVATVTVGDEHYRIVGTLRWLVTQCEVLVVGGGLGPTSDDLTRYAVADLAGVPTERDPRLVEHLEHIYARLQREMPEDALRQADIPSGAQVYQPKGTAAGFGLAAGEAQLYVLPGVPWEFREVAERIVLPDLVTRSGGRARVSRTVHVAGMGESAVGAALRPVSDRLAAGLEDPADPEHGIELGFLAVSDEVLVKLTAAGTSPGHARGRLAKVVDEVTALLGPAVTSVDERRLEDEIGRLLRATGATVVTAETITGGQVAAALSAAPDAAARHLGGFVAAGTEELARLAGVDLGSGLSAGAAAEKLASEIVRSHGADYTVVVFGTVGDVVWAIVGPDGSAQLERRHLPAVDASTFRSRAAAFALETLRRLLIASTSGDGRGPAVTP